MPKNHNLKRRKGRLLARASGNLIITALAILGGAAAFITNIDKIQDFFQPSLDGMWVLTNTIEGSTFSSYRGLPVTYHVFLTHNGRQVSGTGEKIMENGKEIPTSAHSPIEIAGEVQGRSVVARFVLKPAPDGAARETRVQFEWRVVRGGFPSRTAVRLEGTFISTGASSRGQSTGVRASP
jgi:hypothetical protein